MSFGNSESHSFRDADEWQSPPFIGDFYREPDNVCRGLTLPPEDAPGPSSFKGIVDGDFYREADVCKGISLGDSFPLAPPLGKEFGLSTGLGYSSTVLSEKVDIRTERFAEADFPPNAPTDSFFKFEVTTLYVSSTAPFEIGNHLMDFFGQEVVSSFTKVRRQKYSIKVDVFIESMMCTVKARVYNQGSGQFAVEFQRRSGDAISFNTTFQKASTYLKRFVMLAAGSPEAPALLTNFEASPLPQVFAEGPPSEVDLLPLLDMAGLVGAPWLQAQAATSLNLLAAEGVQALFIPRVFQGIAELMQASSAEVMYPTARLIHHLAQHAEAAPLFAAHRLLPMMLGKIFSPESASSSVRLELAKGLGAAIQHQSTDVCSEADAAALLSAFSDCASREMMSCTSNQELPVVQSLEMAHYTLKSKFAASRRA